MVCLIRELIRPYLGTLTIVLAAMPVLTAMSLAWPWPQDNPRQRGRSDPRDP